ncbi:MAG: PopZ family protein [Mesorhizobium sp.]
MATASSVQREPSMEEILASIRRIIEDSDPGRKQPEQVADLNQDLRPAPEEKAEAEVETFRAELRAVPEDRKPFTLADVQAKIAAERQREMPDVEQEAPPSSRPSVTLAEIGAQVSADSQSVDERPATIMPEPASEAAPPAVANWPENAGRTAEASSRPLEPESRRKQRYEAGPDIGTSADELANRPEPEAVVPQAEATVTAEVGPTTRLTLVSEHTGRQVAAAFEELSEAFASRSKKTFDEMAEEMLRPMLQDWLDNNLPTLVERLVREEIERVARGA